jgi:peptide/nickel transport system permease protein
VIGLMLIHVFGFQFGLFRVIAPNSFWATFFAAVALGIPVSARIAEVLIANLDNESEQEYAAVARGRGLGQVRLFAKHLLKPSSLPVVTVIALAIGELLGGSLITETVFGRTGIGSLVQRSVSTQDLPVLQAVVSLAAVVFVLVNLIADLVYPLLDPRVKHIGGPKYRPTTADESSAGTSRAVIS